MKSMELSRTHDATPNPGRRGGKQYSVAWTRELIREQIRLYVARNGNIPIRRTERMPTVDAAWTSADRWLHQQGTSLSAMAGSRVNWSYALLRHQARLYVKAHGKNPVNSSGKMPTVNATWSAANMWLGRRGSSLSEFFGRNSRWSEELIREQIRLHVELHGQNPTRQSGRMPTIDATWNSAYVWIYRNKSPLREILRSRTDWTHQLIRENIEIFVRANWRHPSLLSGQMPTIDATWSSANCWLRGQGSSLSEFARAVLSIKEFRHRMIREQAAIYRDKHGKLPTAASGKLPGRDISWYTFNNWLRCEGTSLFKFLGSMEGE